MKKRPGRERVQHSFKDFSIKTSRLIDWEKLLPFLKKHAKKTEDYISETFDRVYFDSTDLVCNQTCRKYGF